MGNKILKIQSTAEDTSKKSVLDNYVYRDIAMISKPRGEISSTERSELASFADAIERKTVSAVAKRDSILNGKHSLGLTAGIYSKLGIDLANSIWSARARYLLNDLRDINSIFNGLYQCFTWIPGERVILPEFGSKIRLLLYEGITDYNIEQINSEIRHCISEWEPRVKITDIVNMSTDEDTENNTVHLEVLFVVPTLSDTQYAFPLEYSTQK